MNEQLIQYRKFVNMSIGERLLWVQKASNMDRRDIDEMLERWIIDARDEMLVYSKLVTANKEREIYE